jgi:hypothetical protein
MTRTTVGNYFDLFHRWKSKDMYLMDHLRHPPPPKRMEVSRAPSRANKLQTFLISVDTVSNCSVQIDIKHSHRIIRRNGLVILSVACCNNRGDHILFVAQISIGRRSTSSRVEEYLQGVCQTNHRLNIVVEFITRFRKMSDPSMNSWH